MSNIKLKQLSKIGYTNNQARTIAINIMSKFYKHHTSKEVEDLLTDIKTNPQNYVNDEILNKIAFCFIEKKETQHFIATN